jgi:hypothetical protein
MARSPIVTRLDGIGLYDPMPFFESVPGTNRLTEFVQLPSDEARRYDFKHSELNRLATAKLKAESILYNEQQRWLGQHVGEATGDKLVKALGLPAVRVRAAGSPDEEPGGE